MTVFRTALSTCCLVLLASLGLAARLPAQSLDAAERPSEIAVTGGYIYGKPAYGPDNMQGGSFGAMFTRYFHLPVAPSIEGRLNIASTSYVKETTYLGGLRVQGVVFRRFHPYGDFLVGTGTLHFKFPVSSNYTSDNSVVYNYGGGLGVDVFRNIQVTGDYQYQDWNLGTQHGGANAKFNPTLATIGVKYIIPFKSYVGSSRHSHRKDDPR